jgi:hypothetical protein
MNDHQLGRTVIRARDERYEPNITWRARGDGAVVPTQRRPYQNLACRWSTDDKFSRFTNHC